MRNFKGILGYGLLLLVFSAVSLAQSGSIAGTVTDSTGAVVPEAAVVARNVDSNTMRSTTSNGAGSFSLTDLASGSYEITVTKQSFKTFHVTAVQLTVAQVLTVNAKLEAGATSEEVQVRGDQVADIDLETSQVSNLVDAHKISDLPLITRDPYSLVLLSPGTVQTNGNGGFSVNGSRDRNNNFLLDGTDNNDTSVPGGPSGGVLSANPDSTEEFRVITSNFNAEYGRNTGAIIDVLTKSGTNKFHGDAYEFGRWNGFGGARDWFNPSSGDNGGPQNPYVRNQFGYSIGGPIRKDKTFFFFNEEFDRFRTATTGSAIVPTEAFKTGIFTYTDDNGTQVPLNLNPGNAVNALNLPLDPTIQRVLALYPAPTSLNGDGFTGNIFFPTGSKQNSYSTVAKIDEHFTDHETLSMRYGYDHFVDPDPFHDDVLPGGVGATAEKSISDAVSANLTSVLTSNLINNFNFGWNHIYAAFACSHSALDAAGALDQFGNGTDYFFDPFSSLGCLSLGDSNGQGRKTGTTSYTDSVSWVRGNHTFKFGGDFRNVGEGGDDNFFSRRQFSTVSALNGGPDLLDFSAVPADESVQIADAASALYGFVFNDFSSEFFDKSGNRKGTDNKLFRQHEYDGFAQDSWKIRPNLTLNLGLRYQFDSVPYEEGANLSNLLGNPSSFATGQDVVLSLVGPGTGHQLYKNDWSNIEPRVGFSWDPKGDGKTAIRGAFGIFHDRVFGNLFGNARGNPPFEQDYNNFPFQTLGNAIPTDTFGPGFPEGNLPVLVPNTTPSAIIPDGSQLAPVLFSTSFRNPVSNNWTLGIQHELPGNITVDVGYVGSKGTHIFRELNGNPANPTLVAELVAFCTSGQLVPSTGLPCEATDVTKANLFNGFENDHLPFNAVANNALSSPFLIASVGNSTYNALQLKVTRRMTHGLEIQGAYTFSHSIDDSGDPIVPGAGNRGFPRNSLDLAEERGNSDSDIRHVAVFNYIWEVPLGKGKSYLNHGAMGRVFEGFQFSGITTIQGGLPFDVYSTTDSERTGVSNRADLVGNPFSAGPNNAAPGLKVYFTNTDAFAQPAYGGPGNIGRNHEYGPGFVNFNLALSKKMALTERAGMEFRIESYNIFNHPQFTNPGSDPSALGNQLGSPIFGGITSTRGNPDGTTSARQLQVALKLSF